MALLKEELPNDLIQGVEKLSKNVDEMMEAMTQAAADEVIRLVKAKAPTSSIRANVYKTKAYKTPSDGGINTFVYVAGYAPFKGNRTSFSRRGGNGSVYTTDKGVPLDFVAKVYEYGRKGAPFPKRPFMRKAFKSNEIQKTMTKVAGVWYEKCNLELPW